MTSISDFSLAPWLHLLGNLPQAAGASDTVRDLEPRGISTQSPLLATSSGIKTWLRQTASFMLLLRLYRRMVENEQQVLEILMDTADGAFATVSQGRGVAWNRGAEQITGRAVGETLGRPCWEVVNGRDSLRNLV